MLQMRLPTAVLLTLILLAVGGLGGYFFERRRSASIPRPAPTERAEQEAGPPDKPVREKPPVVIEVVAAHPGAAAEEVERQVTVPLEVTFAGMPRLQSMRSTSTSGLTRLQLHFDAGADYHSARQEVINRLQLTQALPPGVTPQLSPGLSAGTLRYLVVGPRDALGRPLYTLNDLKTMQDWSLERALRRLPGVLDVCSSGGTVKRYEIQPDPDRLRRYGITLRQLVDAVAQSNANVNGDPLLHGMIALNVRSVGLFGGGTDPISADVMSAADPQKAASLLRAAEQRRLREIRTLVVAKINDRPITVEDVVDGGRLAPGEEEGKRGVVVASQPGFGLVASSGPGETRYESIVEGIVLMRPGEDPELLRRVEAYIKELNATAGKLLPGVRIEPYHVDGDHDAGALWVHGMFPLSASLEGMVERSRKVVELLRGFPEVERVVSEVGTSENGAPQSSNQILLFVGLKTGPDVPVAPGRERPRSRTELLEEFERLLSAQVPGVDWLTTTRSPQELGLAFPGAPAENLLKIVGPDLEELDRLAVPVAAALRGIAGVESVAAFRSLGRAKLDFRVDVDKCRKWGVSPADVSALLNTALGGRSLSQMIEGEKTFDITVRWPKRLRDSETALLDLPVDITNNKAEPGNLIQVAPWPRLRDLVSSIGKDGEPGPKGDFMRSGAVAIYRENGKRVLPVRFSVRSRPLTDVRAEAAPKIGRLLKTPYRLEWND